jgi:hypothetical protein
MLRNELEEFSKQRFQAAQRPVAWLFSAERLRDAAEAILKHELAAEIPYFRAHAAAEQEAIADAYTEGNEAGVAQIAAMPPNYPPAQLLYAFAIENVLKGLVVAKRPALIQEQELSGELATHDLVKLANKASFTVHVQERPVLEALSRLSVWAGRYPVARKRDGFDGSPNADDLLDYGSAHPVMRMFFDRARNELESRLPQKVGSRFGTLVVLRQPGT